MRLNHAILREILRKYPDGLTAPELARILDKPPADVRRSVNSMPDVYIDRWTAPKRGQTAAVYVAVEVPENCPRPRSKHELHR